MPKDGTGLINNYAHAWLCAKFYVYILPGFEMRLSNLNDNDNNIISAIFVGTYIIF